MFRILLILFLLTTLTACARISVHSDPNLSGPETGIKFYTPKPYILVKRTGAKDNPVEVDVVYLPDLANPLYAKANAGIGSADLDLAFEDGILTDFGQNTDPGVNELISTLADIPKALAEADKFAAEAAAVVAQATSEEIQTSGAAMKGVADDFVRFLALPTTPDVTTEEQRTTLSRLAVAFRTQSQSLLSPGAESRLSSIVQGLEGASKQLAAVTPSAGQEGTSPGMQFWGMVASSKATVENTIKVLKPKSAPVPAPAPPPTVTLYEIISTPTGTKLKEVKFD